MLGSHTACGRKNANRAAGKDLQKMGMYLFSREIVAKVHHRRISIKKGVLLHRDKQFRAMDREGKIDDDANLVALSFTQSPC